MEIDEVKVKKLNNEETAKARQNKECFNCRKQGHFANKCPEKKRTTQIALVQESHSREGQTTSRSSTDDTSQDEEPPKRHRREKSEMSSKEEPTRKSARRKKREIQEVIREGLQMEEKECLILQKAMNT